jgi:hypothetical protein
MMYRPFLPDQKIILLLKIPHIYPKKLFYYENFDHEEVIIVVYITPKINKIPIRTTPLSRHAIFRISIKYSLADFCKVTAATTWVP